MKYKSMFPWMILDMALFVALNVFLLRYLNLGAEILSYLTPFKLFILAFATYRAANIISNEFVATPIRAYFVREVERDGKVKEEPYEEGLRGFVGSLLYCPSCTGVWLAAALTYSYILWPNEVSVVALLLTLSGLERLLAAIIGRIKR
jgi:hypothetical protein